MSTTMKALQAKNPSGLASAQLTEMPMPIPQAGERLVLIHAAALNRADLLQLQGKYPPPSGESDIVGLECAGIDAQTGERVFALLGSGGLAEAVCVDERLLMRIPDSLSFAQATAIPEAWFTAYLNLFDEGRLQSGETVLIHAAASGVGTAAIQLAKWRGATVIATSRTADKLPRCQALGADFVIDTSNEDFEKRVSDITQGKGVDVILDVLGGGEALQKNLGALAVSGRCVTIALMSGTSANINLAQVLTRRLRLIGSTLRSRSKDEKAALTQRFSQACLPSFAAGTLRPVIDSRYAFSDIASAFAHLQSNRTFGKVVIEMKP